MWGSLPLVEAHANQLAMAERSRTLDLKAFALRLQLVRVIRALEVDRGGNNACDLRLCESVGFILGIQLFRDALLNLFLISLFMRCPLFLLLSTRTWQ